jgi:hypothetical protein
MWPLIILLCVLIIITLDNPPGEPTLTRSLTYTKDLRNTLRG